MYFLMFGMFNENRSPFLDLNIEHFTNGDASLKENEAFRESNERFGKHHILQGYYVIAYVYTSSKVKQHLNNIQRQFSYTLFFKGQSICNILNC